MMCKGPSITLKETVMQENEGVALVRELKRFFHQFTPAPQAPAGNPNQVHVSRWKTDELSEEKRQLSDRIVIDRRKSEEPCSGVEI